MSDQRAVLAVTLRDLARAAPSSGLVDLVGRLHALLAVHATEHGGTPVATGLDVAVSVFPAGAPALAAAIGLWDEVEGARDGGGQHHGGVLGMGLAASSADASGFGLAHVRAVRLAIAAEERGEILLDEAMFAAGIPTGFGAHRAHRDRIQRLGFELHVLADYR